jgi:predicted enzyme related to lactoylglutathione lyase
MVVIRLQEVVVDCRDPASLVRFWAGVFGTEPIVRTPDWAYIDAPSAVVRIAFQQVPEAKAVKNRVHLDVEVDDIAGECARVVGLGATAIGDIQRDEQGRFQVLQDPEGNEFCLVD